MLKKITVLCLLGVITLCSVPRFAQAAAGIFASGGGKQTIGSTFTVTVTASGGDFNAFQGNIAVSGPVSVVSFSAGSANWITAPSNNATFSGAILGSKSSSLTIATIKLRGTSVGSGAVTVSGVILKNGTTTVSNSGNSASFSIQKAPELPSAITVTSATHPDQNTSYEATAVTLSWNKGSNVTGFSYLLDQAAATTPPSKATDANTTVTYSDKAVGTYYFHIRAQSADGWGTTTHFKINIKEPDPKINEQLRKPSEIILNKLPDYINEIVAGTFAGFEILGKTEPDFTANIALDPAPTLPEGKALSVKSDAEGLFKLTIDYPVKAGHYKLTVQGQNEKILTPESDPIYFEISQVKGGQFNILTSSDTQEPEKAPAPQEVTRKWFEKINYKILAAALGGALVLVSLLFVFYIVRRKQVERLIRNFR